MVVMLASPATPPEDQTPEQSTHLYLRVCSDRQQQTFVSRQYATYPFRLSRPFRLESARNRAYLYMMNTSPGLFAGDRWQISVQVNHHASLYLTDQAATKVHTMPSDGTAQVTYKISVAAAANLEFVPEPLILYANSRLVQTTQITLAPTGQLFLSEMILPGRLARHEFYQFDYYFSRLRVLSPAGELMFGDAMRLEGKSNPFPDSLLFSALPVIGNIIVVLPDSNLDQLIAQFDSFVATADSKIIVGNTRLPNSNGLLIRAVADSVSCLKAYTRYALNCVRHVSGQSNLPEIPK